MKTLFSFLCCCLGLAAISAQSIISLSEESTSGKYQGALPAESPAIVDINSIIRIKVDVAALEEEMFKFQGIKATDSRLARLRKLNEWVSLQNNIINYINTNFEDESTPSPLKVYQTLAGLSQELLDQIELDDKLYDELTSIESEKAFNQFDGPYILFVINYLEQQAQELRSALLNDLGANGQVDSSLMIYFRIGAFLKNKSGGRPVHVENFDDYTPEEYLEITRFGEPITEEEKAALQRNKRLNDSLQTNTTQLTQHMKGVFDAQIQTIFPKSDTSRLKLKSTFNESLRKLNAETITKPAANILLNNEINIDRIGRIYNFVKTTFENFQVAFPDGIFKDETLTNNLQELQSLLDFAYTQYIEDINLYQRSDNVQLVNGAVPGLLELNRVDTAYSSYVININQFIGGINTVLTNIDQFIMPFKKSYVANEGLTEAVRRFTVGEIPASGYIELKYIGERRAGDEVLIKAVLERGRNRNNRNYEKKEIFRRYVTLSRVAAHFKMSGSLVLGNPYNRASNESVTLENNFQFAPTYGVLMKWGSRKSKFYNDVLSVGVGLAFSSPDFNLDGTPEFGSGIMMTAFRDILSVGWGWNFGVDAPYSFIGFNIPFTIGGLPSASTTTGFVDN